MLEDQFIELIDPLLRAGGLGPRSRAKSFVSRRWPCFAITAVACR